MNTTIDDKAKELVYKYADDIVVATNHENIALAKQCALICVNEILKCDFLIKTPSSFWQKVKEKIQSL